MPTRSTHMDVVTENQTVDSTVESCYDLEKAQNSWLCCNGSAWEKPEKLNELNFKKWK